MKRRWTCLALLLLVALPSMLHARWIKDKVYLETATVGKVEFSHYDHLDAVGKDCPSCHNSIYHIVTKKNPAYTMKQMEAGEACGACHNGRKAFSVKENCDTCHHNGDILFKDEDAGNVTFSHEVHSGMFGCGECHPDVFKAARGANKATMEQMEKGQSCGACHDGSTAFSVKENCESCHAM